jgi:hypothetical protein
MCWLDRWHPEYGFASHKGYATPSHLRSIEIHGLSPHHRRSWAAVARRSSFLVPSAGLILSPSTGRVREGFADAAG